MAENIIYIFYGGLFVLILLLLFLIWIACPLRLGRIIKKKLISIVSNTFFNGLIMSLKISLFKNCISIGNQIKLAVMQSENQTKQNVISAIVLFIVLVIIMVGTGRFMWKEYENLSSLKIINRCGNLYTNAPFSRDKPYILRFPFLILHRLCFVSLASGLYFHICQSL